MNPKILKYSGIAGMVLGVATIISSCGYVSSSCAEAGNEAKRASIKAHGGIENIPLDERLGWISGSSGAAREGIEFGVYGLLMGISFIGAGIYCFEKSSKQ